MNESTPYAVVIITADGGHRVAGPFPDEYSATLFGNEAETEESGQVAHIRPLEDPAAVLPEIRA